MKRLLTLVMMLTLFLVPQFAHAAVTNALPTTEAPTTEAPTTEAPTTEAPTTEAPTTEAPTTEAPTTEAPTTEAPTTEAPTTEAPTNEIKILHTNDMHGRLDAEDGRVIGMAKLKTIKDQENPTFMFDSGDAFQGLPLSNFSKGKDMALAMNAVGYDAMTVGNHEFDFGFDTAMAYKDLLNFPILSSNVYKDGKSVFTPSTVLERNGMKFGIIGVTTPETATKTHPNNIVGITFLDPLQSVTNEMMRLKGQVDAYIILSHLGIDSTTKEIWRGDYLTQMLAKNTDFMNNAIIVLDGHSHSVIENGIISGDTLLAQTGTALANIGKVTYNLDDKTYDASLIKEADTANVVQDPEVKAIAEDAKVKFGEATSEVVFYNKEYLEGEREFVRTQETNLGNAITDAMEAYSVNGFESAGDFAVTNGGGIRASIDANKDVTIGDIIKVLPFGNTITQIDVKGSDVLAMFEHALSAPAVETDGAYALEANGAFLHISKSIRVHYDITKPAGERVYAIEVLNKETGEFEALDMNRTYKVVTNDFLAVGGDGFTMLGGPREEGPSLDAVVSQYFKTADMTVYDTDILTRILGTIGLPVPEEEPSTDDGVIDNDPPMVEDTTTDEEVTTEDDTTKEEVTTEDTTKLATNEKDITTKEDTTASTTVEHKLPVQQTSVVDIKEVKQQKDSQSDAHASLPITGEAAGGSVIAFSLLAAGVYLVRRKSA
ncbi:5'-nucleotidase C-terminal domain-containing protein [Macrococcoides canis]|uniref:5'-nucleotidase C-terminal domain-containing protein n=1 Tax=Macrococcoides canis TaxID=1855823 RepID=UPI001AEBE06E|nr:5'-nucleotidase C-terminal domain-containing protein [Macrococcus canis]QTQ07548.1 5'-nucleotidase C-terminal domain-containing protein [Macrococcus canis]